MKLHNIYNRMKVAALLTLPVAGVGGQLLFSSCSDFLEIKPQNEIIFEDFWNEKADVDAIVAGCYAAMQDDPIIRRMMIWGEFRSDNITAGLNIQNDINLENIFKENITASNFYTTWVDFYNVINRCNIVIKYAPQVAERDPSYSAGELAATIAEVSALRDLCWFYLIRTFRDVPYTNEAFTDDDQVMDLPASKFDDILDDLIADLEKQKNNAVRRYPETKKNYQTGRITQEAIHAMLCEMYLWKKDYANSIRYADLVIQAKLDQQEEALSKNTGMQQRGNNNFNGFPLISERVMDNYWGSAYNAIFGSTGNSSESIFELTYDKENQNMLSNGAVNALYGNPEAVVGLAKPADFIAEDGGNDNWSVFTNKYDARAYELRNEAGSVTGIAKYVKYGLEISTTTATQPQLVASGTMYAKDKNKSNWIIYRLTDIMLLKAEALVEQMTNTADSVQSDAEKERNEQLLSQAFTLVNAVNKRSICEMQLKDTLVQSDYNTKSLMSDLVLKERQRELMFEGKRWYDLVRRSQRDGNTAVLSKLATQKVTENKGGIQTKLARMDAIYWPYNLDELKVNHNLTQNPAFGSGENGNYQKTN
ncbi:MAG: RagB/SusD family nutrient uptake outer membrane protein [Prevotella sp.]|nr:RagB/SusD family nutrient uptake outer membrane protein [Prevotella sp.]